MKQNKEGADRSVHADEDIVLEAQTLRRLESIRKDDENCDDVLTRLLDNAVQNVPIEEILRDLLSQFEDAVSIDVDLSSRYKNPGMLIISVHTGEVSFEENVSLYAGKESRAMIESKVGEQFYLPFDIIATCDGPKRETMSTTPVYATDSILGMEPVSLDEGLDQLRTKIGKPRDELRELVNDH
ncbi:hypothetical protein [Natronosalvus caseinilyticus]|uniref:hypothetical protein n=1 Tax=Natronosalvus caseinilyticus TaxID=2953747 RepID=UPI0028AECCE6|nr:hypothetical protein [Natronosalvus caseinilyticus]